MDGIIVFASARLDEIRFDVEKKIFFKLQMNNILSLNKVATEGSLLVAAGLGYFALKKLHKPPVFEQLSHTCHVKHSNVAQHVMDLRDLKMEEDWFDFVQQLDVFMDISKKENAVNAWIANRCVTNLRATVNYMLERAKMSKDVDLIDVAVRIVNDVVPALDGLYDEVIHNMLLT
jgi:hypothetical protein